MSQSTSAPTLPGHTPGRQWGRSDPPWVLPSPPSSRARVNQALRAVNEDQGGRTGAVRPPMSWDTRTN